MRWKKLVNSYLLLVVISLTIIALDQVSKAYVREQLHVGQMWMPVEALAPYLRIVNWYNTGVAFGLFQGMGPIFTILAVLVAIAIVYYFPKISSQDWIIRIALGLQLGGAVGNLIDRVVFGRVTDFVSIGNFPVFNVADASITVGVIVLILGIWIQDGRQRRELQKQSTEMEIDPPFIKPVDGIKPDFSINEQTPPNNPPVI